METRSERYAQALRKAADTLGGTSRLARILRVESEQLARWLDGRDSVPLPVFLTTLDVIADGPYAGADRRIRVAVIRNAGTARPRNAR